MKRRDFLKATAAMAAAVGMGGIAEAAPKVPVSVPGTDGEEPDDGRLIISEPMLQNYAESSMGVVFAVSALANGFVEYGLQPDLSDARKVLCGGFRTTDIDDKVIRVRLTGLQPSTTYYYRIGADRIKYKDGYNMSVLGTEISPKTYSFTTAGEASRAHFCVINDTHARWESYGPVSEKVAALAPSCVIWNGDATNREETIDKQRAIFLLPQAGPLDYAASTPYLLCPGNHDQRGMANRHLERMWMYRQAEERSPRDWDLGRNFAVRMGEVAMIGLDTGEDKLDSNPRFAGLFNNGAYREAQTEWLRDALQLPQIASAPFLVAFCHIPLYDNKEYHNPGDVYPDDRDIRYNSSYAKWQRSCGKMWGPLLSGVGCQLLITGHQHKYRCLPAADGRSWAEIIGGGPDMGYTVKDGKRKERPESYPTVVEGKVEDGVLNVTVYNIATGEVQDRFTFNPR